MSQSNTREGDVQFLAGEDLTGKEGYVVQLTSVNGAARMVVPTRSDSTAAYVLLEGGAEGERVPVRPMEGRRNVRLRLKGVANPGNVLILADTGVAGDRGMVRQAPESAGTYRGVAIAEEGGVDGQLILARPHVADYTVVIP